MIRLGQPTILFEQKMFGAETGKVVGMAVNFGAAPVPSIAPFNPCVVHSMAVNRLSLLFDQWFQPSTPAFFRFFTEKTGGDARAAEPWQRMPAQERPAIPSTSATIAWQERAVKVENSMLCGA
jgi:hypothetical protein